MCGVSYTFFIATKNYVAIQIRQLLRTKLFDQTDTIVINIKMIYRYKGKIIWNHIILWHLFLYLN